MTHALLDKISSEIKKDYSEVNWKGSFWEYTSEKLRKEPYKSIRTSLQFLNDSIEYFGRREIEDCGETITRYGIFEKNAVGRTGALYGIDRILMNLCNYIKTLAWGGGEERIVMIHGPPATGKSSIVNFLINGMEEYSKTNNGELFTFEWLFVEDTDIRDVGFDLKNKKEEDKLRSYAHLDDKDISAKIQCQLRDNPLLLISKEHRAKCLEEEVFKDKDIKIPKKILEGQLCFNCQNIYNVLLDKYKGNFYKVLRHIRVKRFLVSERNHSGAATVRAANTEGAAPLVVWEEGKELSKLGELFRGLKLHTYYGKWADANRGVIHFQDLFDERSGVSLKALKDAAEEHFIDFDGILGFIDAIIFGSTNIDAYTIFNENPLNAGLRRRIRTVNVTYLLQAKEEEKIYLDTLSESQVVNVKKNPSDRHIMPHTLEIAALWAVMTRYIKPNKDYNKSYYGKIESEEKDVVSKITPLIKARLYDGDLNKTKTRDDSKASIYNPNALGMVDKAILSRKHLQRLIRNEYSLGKVDAIEGMDGISPSIMQNLFTDIIGSENMLRLKGESSTLRCISPHQVIKGLEHIIESGDEVYPFLAKQKYKDLGYHDFEKMIETLDEEYESMVAREVEWAIINVNPSVLDKKVNDYIKNVLAYLNKGTIKDPQTLKEEPPSEDKMREVENAIIGINDNNRIKYREDLIKKIAKVKIDQGAIKDNVGLDFKSIFSDIYNKLQHHLFEDKKKTMNFSLTQLKSYVERYGTKKFLELDKKNQQEITDIINNMIAYDYCEDCAKETIAYAINEKIIE